MTLFLSGCGPPGPRALLKGAKYLERGDYPAAVDEFKTATSLMSTNAQAWNYLGVALQHAGHPADAALAYQRALSLDRDLVEAHYNLGCLWLEQNRPDVARTEFTAYVLRRSKASGGWTQLGVAQLRLHDLVGAEKSFNTALSIDPKDADALNGLGLAQIRRNRPRDAVQYFAAAVKAQPDFGPALLNLATVERQYLHDNALALQNYRAYLALTPRRPDWEQVNAMANELEQDIRPTATATPPARPIASTAQQPERKGPSPVTRVQTPARSPRIASEEPRPEASETVTAIISGERPKQTNKKTTTLQKMNPLNWFRPARPESNRMQVAATNPEKHQPKLSSESEQKTNPVTPPPPIQPRPSRRFHLVQPAAPSFPHYLYLSPSKPAPGDRKSAGRAFAQAQQFEQDKQYEKAMESYRLAAQLDPSWFEAQYDYGVVAYRLNHLDQSLRAYEMALAIQPRSEDARYNLALALKGGGYVPDAVNELKKLLASQPDDVRAHLALGNLYAQQLYDFSQARVQYQEVLRLDPGNPQAADIQFWLSSNPP